MTPGEFREFAKTMREFGLTRVKMGDVELEFAPSLGGSIGNAQSDPTPVGTTSAESNPIEHKVEQLTSLMKLGDVALVDALFPDYTEDAEEAG